MPEGDGPTAWQSPTTRSCHAAYRLGALRWFVGGIAGLILAIGLSTYAVWIRGRPGLGALIVAALLVGIIGVITGAGGLVRARRFRWALQRSPWRPAELRVTGANLRLVFDPDDLPGADGTSDTAAPADDPRPADEPRTPDDPRPPAADVRMMSTSRWRMREVVGYRDAEVLVCPAGQGSYVLTAQGSATMYGLVPLARHGRRERL